MNVLSYNSSGVNTVGIFGGAEGETHIIIKLISKD